MTQKEKPSTLQAALIGLIGTLLTVCGGLSGALITSAVTIYQVQRQSQKIDLPASSGENKMKVDTGSIFISRQEAAGLDPAVYYVNLEHAFALQRPLPGWGALEELTVGEQLAESQITCVAVCDQPVYRIRYGEPVEIESDRGTTVNGKPIPDNLLELAEKLHGPPPWKAPYYSQMVLNVFYKDDVRAQGVDTLADIILLTTNSSSGQVNRLIARPGSHFAIIQRSNTYENIRLNGAAAKITLEDWLLFAETEKAFYTLEIAYTPQSGQSVQVWDDLQKYLDQFRVIQ